ncbi:hypothetical protein [Chondromyces apiculatus]|uniref:Glutamine amidotransferase domain-containing protein n=1 Tax=Chondromyces apiculatus DSM 436 TaxID=1192034 RepID=A0A017TGG5_9BACT|nr:hypothetical protein [Chondromyces apiculatus]EYF07910.1 Hypothetical protein CAP_6932 [Chondromyces apiculatus DSM 436]
MTQHSQHLGPSAPTSTNDIRPLRLCIVDMNNGHVNQAMRCLRGMVATFFERVRLYNPQLDCQLVEVSPRDTNNPIPRDCDLYIGTGGPGSPFDGAGDPWTFDLARFFDETVESTIKGGVDQRAMFAICHSFEMAVQHFAFAKMAPRVDRKFGIMPVYMTPAGQTHPLLAPFGDRLFAFEHRNWEAVDLDERKLASLGGSLLALESRDGISKGRAILGVDIAPGIEAVQFHPEADRAGVVNWISRPEQAAAFKATYGEVTYQAMLRTLDDPRRVARTYTLLIPGWLTRRFNLLAPHRDYVGLPPVPDVIPERFAPGGTAMSATPPRPSTPPSANLAAPSGA